MSAVASIDERFQEFHRDNPHVYRELAALARKMKATGRNQYGIASLFEVLRWHRALETTDQDFKVNNDYRALYARLLMEQEPDLAGFFEIRERRAA